MKNSDGESGVPIGTYFAASQPTSRFHITYADWTGALGISLLLLPELHIADGGLLAHPYFLRHLNAGPGTSWLERGLRNGWVVVRTRDERSLRDIGEGLSRFAAGHPESAAVGARLDSLSVVRRAPWSIAVDVDTRAFGETFQLRLADRITRPLPLWSDYLGPQQTGRALLDFWDRRADWRTNWLDRAAERTRQDGHRGLRVSDLLREARESLGIRDLSGEFIEVSSLIDGVDDPVAKRDLNLFFRIVTEVYDQNFASRIRCQCASVNLEYDCAAATQGPRDDASGVEGGTLLGEVALPSTKALERLTSIDLELLRASAEALTYVEALRAWMVSPTEAAACDFAEALQLYGRKLCEVAYEDQSTNVGILGFARKRYVSRALGATTGLFMGFALNAMGLGPVAQVANSVCTLALTDLARRMTARSGTSAARVYARPIEPEPPEDS
ncbi:hypothetical protein [Engelhardtia mirabilis]|uniref:Uncharacterized protein n=1 Tax=Engelhardtia mirabilis TaxID=2528011 RepID=A0A518BHG4_9BACT|nr:hypothetical protein Pla133_14780 [Planctomycetes bacterium Pla133]QDV00732.1 hypothetical protein Pla86_14770 [Planctomycetes bacterium Pla86]